MRNWKSHDRRAAIPVFFWKNVDFELRGVEPLIVSKASVNGSRVWWRLFGNILLAHLVKLVNHFHHSTKLLPLFQNMLQIYLLGVVIRIVPVPEGEPKVS
jgi:hypothetical protein